MDWGGGLAAARHRTGRPPGEGSDWDCDYGKDYGDDDDAVDDTTSVPRKVECEGGGWPGWIKPELGWSLNGEGQCRQDEEGVERGYSGGSDYTQCQVSEERL